MNFDEDFLWGAATSAHQVEGGNTLSDWWRMEQRPGGLDKSGDAIDHYNRYPEDIQLLADSGLTAYRFGLEWARIETSPGEFSKVQLDHYRRMIATTIESGLTPVVSIHHFTHPTWFVDEGSWLADSAHDRFLTYVEKVIPLLDGVEWVTTFNESNMLSMLVDRALKIEEGQKPTSGSMLSLPSEEIGGKILEAHRSATILLKENLDGKVGMTVAAQALTPTPGNEDLFRKIKWTWEDMYWEGARGDDYVGVQSYTSQSVDETGIVPHQPSPENTQMGWAYRPDAVGIAVRNAFEVTEGVPLVVTENGIATADDNRRIEHTTEVLRYIAEAIDEGIDIRGYIHWAAFDNFEWGTWEPTFGLVAVDRDTFERTPKPSLEWLGGVACSGTV